MGIEIKPATMEKKRFAVILSVYKATGHLLDRLDFAV